MVRLSCIFRSFISHRSYIEANDSENPKPQRKIAGAFFRFFATVGRPVAKSTIMTR
jgi:hypothetical protein